MFRSPEKGCQNFGGIKPKPRMTLLSKPRASISLADFCIYLQINPWKSKNSRSFGPQKRRKLFFEKDQAYVPVGSAAIDCLHVTTPDMGSSGQINRGSRARSAAERVESGGQDVESKQDRAFFRGGLVCSGAWVGCPCAEGARSVVMGQGAGLTPGGFRLL